MAGKRASQGIVLPSPVMVLSVVVVLVAAVVFLATRGGGSPQEESATPAGATATATATPSATPSAEPSPAPTKKPEPKATPKPVERDNVFVEVYNNAGIPGLADRVGGQASGAGWNVVGTDNWYGTVPSSTVYFPDRLQRQADQLALDLGIDRVMPSVGAMKGDRLTVILTGDL